MVAIRTRFDGQTIQVPDELRGARPGEVLIVIDERNLGAGAAAGASIWDYVGKADKPRTAGDIEQQLQSERNSWDQR